MPGPMRHDVRLLGGLLGEVLRDAGGQDLLDDVEQLRHAVIEARRHPESKSLDDIAAMVAAWPLDRAEQVASAFTVYFHLANLAEEHQRIRALRERDTDGHPLPESAHQERGHVQPLPHFQVGSQQHRDLGVEPHRLLLSTVRRRRGHNKQSNTVAP